MQNFQPKTLQTKCGNSTTRVKHSSLFACQRHQFSKVMFGAKVSGPLLHHHHFVGPPCGTNLGTSLRVPCQDTDYQSMSICHCRCPLSGSHMLQQRLMCSGLRLHRFHRNSRSNGFGKWLPCNETPWVEPKRYSGMDPHSTKPSNTTWPWAVPYTKDAGCHPRAGKNPLSQRDNEAPCLPLSN